MRPRVSVTLLRLATVDAAARRLDVADVRCGRFATQLRITAQRPRIHRRVAGPGGGHSHPPSRIVYRRPRAAGGPPVYARATVAGLPVLIVGGDRPFPHPLGGNEAAAAPGSLGSRATRIACPCDQPPPCLHGQALYAHIVSRLPPIPRRPHAGGGADRRPHAEAWSDPCSSLGAVGATRKVSRSQPAWLTIRAPMGMPAAASADQ
jgi:hypothetical protein